MKASKKPDFALVIGHHPMLDGKEEEGESEVATPESLPAAMEELIAALKAEDAEAAASAFHAAFLACESEPHEEAEEDEQE